MYIYIYIKYYNVYIIIMYIIYNIYMFEKKVVSMCQTKYYFSHLF